MHATAEVKGDVGAGYLMPAEAAMARSDLAIDAP